MTSHESISYEQKVAVALNDLPAIGLPELIYTDGPNGIRGAEGATAFPSGLAVAASFDRSLARGFGVALARESLAAGRNGILGPGLDIARVPWGGRVAEALGEDPVLVGEVGAEIVQGIQSLGVLSVPKHFVANNFEYLRTGRGSLPRRSPAVDVLLSARALREVYAEPFRRALLHGGAGAVLSSYNRIDGDYVSENAAVLAILRDEWGWPGFVTPDFLHAVRDDRRALDAGLDFPALGGTAHRTEEMVRAVDEAHLDAIVRRTRWALERIQVPVAPESTEPLDDSESQDLAQLILERGSVLLQNDGALPLAAGASVALVGVEDIEHLLVMGGSAAVTLSPDRTESLSAGLLAAGAGAVTSIAGSAGDQPLATLEQSATAEIRDEISGVRARVDLTTVALYEVPETIGDDWVAEIITDYTPTVTGAHRLTASFAGEVTVHVDGEPLASGYREASPMFQGPEYPVQAIIDLEAGRAVEIRIDYRTGAAFRVPPIIVPGVKVGLAPLGDAIERAAQTAADADIAVVVVGRVSGEAMDVDGLRLPGDQELLIRAVSDRNPRTIVVTCGAGPIVMDWADDVASVLHVWNPGERFAPALGRMLFGIAEPGGRLPLTFPRSEQETPVSTPERYPGVDGVVHYDDDLLVGYRWYHSADVSPRFAFGHGLGYTTHEIDGLTVESSADLIVLDAHLTNTGERDGRGVMQVYVTPPAQAQSPARTLVGFASADTTVGAGTHLQVELRIRDLAIWNDDARRYEVLAGRYEFEAGLSCTDIHASVIVELPATVFPSPPNTPDSEEIN